MQQNIAVIAGSLRQGSYARATSRALAEVAPASMTLSAVEIGTLPLYNEDLETQTPPSAWTQFRAQIIASDAVIFVTPEYNRGIPGALKNAIDVGSRPWGKSAWNAKPAAVISTSPGALGGMAAHHQLRQVLYGVNLATMAYPEAYIPAVATLFDENGKLQSAEARQFLTAFMQSFATWVAQLEPIGG